MRKRSESSPISPRRTIIWPVRYRGHRAEPRKLSAQLDAVLRLQPNPQALQLRDQLRAARNRLESMPVLLYSETQLDGRLSEFVDCLWSVTIDPSGPGTPSHWVLPDGCATLSFHLTPPVSLRVRGPSLLPYRAPAMAGEQSVGFRFRPGALARIGTEWAENFGRRDFGTRTIEDARSILEDELDRVISAARDPDCRSDRVVSLIRESAGRISIAELSEHVNWSERQLERRCADTLDLNPKQFARTVRLQAVLRRLIEDPRADLAATADQFGYSDQAHMGREFIALGALTPGRYVKMLKGMRFVSDLF
jgi:AraC-like DNA-binding protein